MTPVRGILIRKEWAFRPSRAAGQFEVASTQLGEVSLDKCLNDVRWRFPAKSNGKLHRKLMEDEKLLGAFNARMARKNLFDQRRPSPRPAQDENGIRTRVTPSPAFLEEFTGEDRFYEPAVASDDIRIGNLESDAQLAALGQ